jgi:anti-sigma regulatory factor (Ser/Thr protein kinase)
MASDSKKSSLPEREVGAYRAVHDVQEWRAAAEPATVRAMRHVIAEFAFAHGITGQALDDVRACVSEAVTNAVVHADRDGRPRGIVSVLRSRDQRDRRPASA